MSTITIYPVSPYNAVARSTTHEYLDIGPTPSGEKCIQISLQALEENKLECNVYIGQLIRQYGEPPAGADYFLLKNSHEMGIYYEAAIRFLEDNEAAADYAYKVETGCEHWDDLSKQQLREAGYSLLKSAPVVQLRRA